MPIKLQSAFQNTQVKLLEQLLGAVVTLPINALGIVILSHILSLMSSPESGAAIVLTIVLMSVVTESPSPS